MTSIPDPPGARTPPAPADETPGAPGPGREAPRRPAWTFLTNHGHVLLAVAQTEDVRVAEIAARVGITTRATLAILKDLEQAGYLSRRRVGRRSHYTVDGHRPFRHPETAAHEVGELLEIFGSPERTGDDPA